MASSDTVGVFGGTTWSSALAGKGAAGDGEAAAMGEAPEGGGATDTAVGCDEAPSGAAGDGGAVDSEATGDGELVEGVTADDSDLGVLSLATPAPGAAQVGCVGAAPPRTPTSSFPAWCPSSRERA
eukprot:TRINITY_DN603_c0_g1_i12.p2 TRINITY_DN603_c0_g1~~TRINITY_DN603_c0_g1_i12.p2  ORF type:complete len:126 (+),score=15.65 TRINITY_DN603_c0_g1_i12:152-529(+)